MRRLALAALLALGTAFAAGSASAAPAIGGSVKGVGTPEAQTVLVQNRGQFRRNRMRNRDFRFRSNDNRYDRYRGWRRYNSRPYNYRARGCVVVGPIWFCP